MGTVFYDLASLLRDSYVTLPEDAVEDLRYAWRNAATAELRGAAGDPGAFAWRFDLAALQRNVKAIGTFGNQAHNRGKRIYLRFIPPTVGHLRGNFERNPPMRGLAERLLPIPAASPTSSWRWMKVSARDARSDDAMSRQVTTKSARTVARAARQKTGSLDGSRKNRVWPSIASVRAGACSAP